MQSVSVKNESLNPDRMLIGHSLRQESLHLRVEAGQNQVVDQRLKVVSQRVRRASRQASQPEMVSRVLDLTAEQQAKQVQMRSEEHTSELQSRPHLVCRLLLEKKKQKTKKK